MFKEVIKKSFLFFVALVGVVAFGSVFLNASASEVQDYFDEINFDDPSVLVVDGSQSEEEQALIWEEFWNNPDIEAIFVLDPDLMEEDFIFDAEDMTVQDRVFEQRRITNVRNLSNLTGSNVVAAASGAPGMTLSISQSRTIANSVTATFGATHDQIQRAVGFTVTGSRTLTISGRDTVPRTHNGRQVNHMTMNAHTIFQRRQFTVQSRPVDFGGFVGSWRNVGTATASRPIGFAFRRIFTFR